MLHGFVEAVNITFRKSISWPIRTKLSVVMENFKQWHGLSNVHGGINGTHILIYKPKTFFPEYYYYHKTCNYFIVVQAVVHCNKKCEVMLMILESYIGLHCINIFNFMVCLITKV